MVAASIVAAGQPVPVAVEFFVNGVDGPVFDLRADEVSLRVDGRQREVRSLRYVSLPGRDPLAPASSLPADADLPYGSNLSESAGRWVSIVLDHESIRAGAEKNAINSVVRFVTALGPRDHVAVIKAPRGNVETEFTTDHEAVLKVLRRFVGRASRQDTEQDRSCRSRLLLNAVEEILHNVTPLEGPKLLVVLSSGLLNPRRDNPPNRAPGPCEISLDDFQKVNGAATQSGAHVFVVQPDDMEIDPTADRTVSRFAAAEQDRGGLESLAGAAGGEFMRIVGPEDAALQQVAKATSGYYVATFDADPADRTGQARRLQVSVRRDGVRVRSRSDVAIARTADRPVTPKAADDMLRDGVLYRALPLRLAAFTSLGAGDKVNVVAALEATERNVKLTSAVFGLIDEKGKLAGKWTANSTQLGMRPLVSAGEIRPGIYRLRATAVDSSGRQGSVEYDVIARLIAAEPLQLSGLVLGTIYDSRFMPKLLFGTDQAAAVVGEAYGATRGGAVSARIDVSAADGRVLATAPASVAEVAPDRRTISGSVPIASLTPGDYVVRVVVSIAGRPVGQTTRILRKTPFGM